MLMLSPMLIPAADADDDTRVTTLMPMLLLMPLLLMLINEL